MKRESKRKGNLVVPEFPMPSNAVIRRLSNGTTIIELPRPTPQVLLEYQQAIEQTPDNAEIRFYFSLALQRVGRGDEAIEQARLATQIKPDYVYHSRLASLLANRGDYDQAVEQLQQALHLLETSKPEAEQTEAMLRAALSETLLHLRKREEAQEELERAVILMRKAINKGQGSQSLLEQMQTTLRRYQPFQRRR